MGKIKLTKNQIALVDDEDFEYLNQFSWFAVKDENKHTFYATRHIYVNGKRTTSRMHREILKINIGEKIIIDHKNRNGLDCRKENLRIVNGSLSTYNSKKRSDNTSGYRGINKHGKRWQAAIGIEGKSIHIGSFSDKESAAKAYDKAAIEYYGENAILNFPLIKEGVHGNNCATL